MAERKIQFNFFSISGAFMLKFRNLARIFDIYLLENVQFLPVKTSETFPLLLHLLLLLLLLLLLVLLLLLLLLSFP